jgi:cell fate regulator YaaT (PSP1 superfamily)
MASYVVRCGTMRTLHVMQARQEFSRAARVIARTQRGLEVGEVLCEADERALAAMVDPPGGSIQRIMTAEDENEHAHLMLKSVEEADTCFRIIRELDLPMDLVDIERVFGGERMVIYYLSEDRVDFRELVKRLAQEFQTRIEMRQIGVRDEALDPSKISGRCGRLKCCLRYEYDIYEENRKQMPRVGADIVTAEGRGRVLGQELLSLQLLVQMEDNRRVMLHASDVLSVIRRGNQPEPREDADVEEKEEQQ